MEDHQSETDFVVRVQNGDLAAYEELLGLHSSRLRAFIAMKLPISHLIDEIAHETFIFAYRNISDFEAGTDFGKWLRAIAYNLIRKESLRHQRLSRNQERFVDHYLLEQADNADWSPESPVVIHLEECLRKLPDQQRQLLDHKYRLSESSRDMAKAFDQSEAWVRTTLCRIRTALRKCIEMRIESSPNLV